MARWKRRGTYWVIAWTLVGILSVGVWPALAATNYGEDEVTVRMNIEAYPDGRVVKPAPAEPDYYTELHRAQYHFSTPLGRLADPNGLVYYDGEYHLFHQKMGTWAHAVSRDLLHWEHLPIALHHDHLGQALSGSVVVDWHDSSGLFNGKPGLVAVYTNTEGGEAQSIAYSTDRGRTWTRYEGNPVIPNPGIKDFRDPKVFWHDETAKWVMVVSTDKSVTFYNSDNLIDWSYLSRFGAGHGTHVAVWETPDLFRLPVDGDDDNEKWVLHVGVGDNDAMMGSTGQYFIGDFDGVSFTNHHAHQKVLITDFGQDFYAAQSFANIPPEDGRRIWLGWMVNWRYPYESPTHPWKGTMSIPRELSLRTMDDGTIQLFQQPIEELRMLRATRWTAEPFDIEGVHGIDGFAGSTFEFELEMTWEEAREFGIVVRGSEGESTVIGVDVDSKRVFVDRTDAGLPTLLDRHGRQFPFGRRFETAYPVDRQTVKIHGFVDESSVEVFINDGEIVFTNLIFTRPSNRAVQLYSKGGSVDVTALNLYHLRSVWRPAPEENDVERIVLDPQHVMTKAGMTTEVQAIVKPDWIVPNGRLVWEVVDPEVADVSYESKGKAQIIALSKGMTRLRVTDEPSGKSATIPVWVD